MQSNLLESRVDDILEKTVSKADGELLVVDPSQETLEALVSVATALDANVDVSVLSRETVLKEITSDFIFASRMADLVADGQLSLHVLDTVADNSLLLWDDAVLAIVSGTDSVSALAATDAEFIRSVQSSYQEQISEAPEFSLRTPPLSEVRRTLRMEISEAAQKDFDSMLESIDRMGEDEPVDEVVISLLTAARNEVLLYDISKWGEDVGVASKATFSRTKTRLEDADIIETEKVPIDVGRPRLRLTLSSSLTTTEPVALVDATRAAIGR